MYASQPYLGYVKHGNKVDKEMTCTQQKRTSNRIRSKETLAYSTRHLKAPRADLQIRVAIKHYIEVNSTKTLQ